jgi:soluble lytic murein transglycosylase-like protein
MRATDVIGSAWRLLVGSLGLGVMMAACPAYHDGASAQPSSLLAAGANDRNKLWGAESPVATTPPSQTSLAGDRRARYRALIREQAKLAGLPPEIAEAVAEVESGLNPQAVGAAGEIGLMQVLPSTARMLGFTGTTAELADPATNVSYGVRYLAGAWRLAAGDLCTTVMKYRAGHGEARFSHRSVDYCLKTRSKLAARAYPLVGTVPVATFGEPVAAVGRHGSWHGRLGRSSVPNLTALNAQLRAIVSQVAVARVR